MKSSGLFDLTTILFNKAFASFTKMLDGFRCPPVLQIALLVVLTSLVVKPKVKNVSKSKLAKII